MYNNTVKCPQIEQSWVVVIEYIRRITAVLGITVATVFAVIPSYIRFLKPTRVLMLLAVFYFLCWTIPNFSVTVMYHTYFSGTLIKERIALGKWNTIFCCLDAIGSCKSQKPILAIRDVKNFPDDQLHTFFSMLKPIKEKEYDFLFSIIIETSDNLWVKEAYSDTSNAAFSFYFMEAMSYNEVKEEIVERFGLFDEQTYDNLYKLFGGHMRFYEAVWKAKNTIASYDDVMKELMQEQAINLAACLMHVKQKKQKEVISLLAELQEQNFTLEAFFLSDTTKALISCNVLFYNPVTSEVTVQNPLLQESIKNFLKRID